MLEMFLNHPPIRKTQLAIRDGKCVGYICVRQKADGTQLCPLVADDVTIAELLLRTTILMFGLHGKFIYMYVPDQNFDVTKLLLRRYGMTLPDKLVGATMMCTKPEVANRMKIPWQKIFCAFLNNWTMY